MVKFDRWVGAEALLCDCNADNINHLFIFFQIQQIIHQIQFIFPISTKLGFSSAFVPAFALMYCSSCFSAELAVLLAST